MTVAARGGPCTATTKAGRPCPIEARPSGFCHVHDPELQCGRRNKRGQRCNVATGGGPCKAHDTTPLPGQVALGFPEPRPAEWGGQGRPVSAEFAARTFNFG